MAKRKPRPVTSGEIRAAVADLEIKAPIRSAERKGTQIILHTRNGDFAWTLYQPEKAAEAILARTVQGLVDFGFRAIVLLAECSEGLGNATFQAWLQV